ncbi:hypothetical protein [Paraburkholderia sp. GAS334]|uniref:hypothetical protein n=1 Tax=Paraburkholderia sp. GAS334 TaxID=3035131 RepID=UPI003D220A92
MHMTLARRLLFTLSVAQVALIFVGGYGLWRLFEARQRFEYVQDNIIPGVKELEEARIDGDGYLRLNFQYLLSTDDAGRAAIQQEMEALAKVIDQHLASHVAYNVKLGHDLRDQNNAPYSQAFWLLMACIAVAVVVSGGLGLQLYRSVTSGLNRTQGALQRVSESLELTRAASCLRDDDHTGTRRADAISWPSGRPATVACCTHAEGQGSH